MRRRLALTIFLFASPATADIPTIDGPILERRQQRQRHMAGIEDAAVDRQSKSQGVACATHRPAHRNDPAAAANVNPAISGLVRHIAREEGVNETQFLALVYQESRFNPCAKSGAGALGLAQLMPGTAKDLGVNAHDMIDNLRGGARYFKQQLDRFKGDTTLALAAYNAGPGNVQKFAGIPPFRETRNYVDNIIKKWVPALGGGELPRGYGGSDLAFQSMRDSTVTAMGTSEALSAGSGNVASWFQQFGEISTATVQESWDHNSGARNANLEMLNQLILLGTVFADLANARNTMKASELSGARQSVHYRRATNHDTRLPAGSCVWDAKAEACVLTIKGNSQLQLTPE
jgi:hypothetical protein